jgi:hypothetical protein
VALHRFCSPTKQVINDRRRGGELADFAHARATRIAFDRPTWQTRLEVESGLLRLAPYVDVAAQTGVMELDVDVRQIPN